MSPYHSGQLVISVIFIVLGIIMLRRCYNLYREKKIIRTSQKFLVVLSVALALIFFIYGGISEVLRVISESSTDNSQSIESSKSAPSTEELVKECASRMLEQVTPESGITSADTTNYCRCDIEQHSQKYGSIENSMELAKNSDREAIEFKSTAEKYCLEQAGLVVN